MFLIPFIGTFFKINFLPKTRNADGDQRNLKLQVVQKTVVELRNLENFDIIFLNF